MTTKEEGSMTQENMNDALMKWAESDAPTVRTSDKTQRGEDARAAARALLVAAAGDDSEQLALIRHVSVGRPTLDESGRVSTMWKVRATPALDEAMRARAVAEGRNLSELLRTAAAEYLAKHAS
jgi:phage-related baseplate assembly protein